MQYRVDHPAQESATIGSFVIEAVDEGTAWTESFRLDIKHVRAFHGKGFVPTVRGAGSMATGGVEYGTGREAYIRAIEAGRKILQRQQNELNAALAAARSANPEGAMFYAPIGPTESVTEERPAVPPPGAPNPAG